jgi:hypothetical protein
MVDNDDYTRYVIWTGPGVDVERGPGKGEASPFFSTIYNNY